MIETIADHLTLEHDGRVAIVTVNRPEAAPSLETRTPAHDGVQVGVDKP